MQATTFTSVLGYLGSLFKTIIYKLDDFYLVGSFSIFDFIVASLVIDIVLTAFFVSFNVGYNRASDYYQVQHKKAKIKK